MMRMHAEDTVEPDRFDGPRDRCVAVVIPCYRVSRQIAGVLGRIGPEVSLIYCVDDACPENSGLAAQAAAGDDSRFHLTLRWEL